MATFHLRALHKTKRDLYYCPLDLVTPYLNTIYSDAPSSWAGSSVNHLQPGGQIMPTTLLLAHPDLKT